MTSTADLFRLSEFEQLLNEFSGKRYHLRINDSTQFSLVEVEKIGKEKIIVENLIMEQMYAWFKKHLRITISESGSS